jgi:hypothetical protein
MPPWGSSPSSVIMTHRRSPARVSAVRAWDRFVSANSGAIAASGIPTACLASIRLFDDFLKHGGGLHHLDDAGFRVESLSADQYAELVVLVESYFAAGYEWFEPSALRPAERHRLASRFGASGAG